MILLLSSSLHYIIQILLEPLPVLTSNALRPRRVTCNRPLSICCPYSTLHLRIITEYDTHFYFINCSATRFNEHALWRFLVIEVAVCVLFFFRRLG
jgi:hypothetical protein